MTLPARVDIAIVGGGPVGLTLACLLAQQGVECVVLEQRTERAPHSRAIGIHPPGLAVLAKAGLKNALLEHGVRITAGQVFYGATPMGRLPLDQGDEYPFVLSLPQTETERLLEARLNELAPGALHRGVTVSGCVFWDGTGVTLEVWDSKGDLRKIEARYVVACDGKNSAVRKAAGIPFPGGKYPDCYRMGDFDDNTPFGTDAALFLSKDGIVESFPLPGKRRRWVAHFGERSDAVDAHEFAAVIERRTGHLPPADTCTWLSAFGIEHYVASTMYLNHCFLAGDAAHVVSPIGGQGMNLGFLDAADLARRLPLLLSPEKIAAPNEMHRTPRAATQWDSYGDRCIRAANIALRRAYVNTLLGRPCPPWHPNRAVAWGIVHIPALSRRFARIFTMQDIR